MASRLGADVQALDAPIAIINELLKDAQELGEHDDEGEALDVAEALADVALALEQAAASSVGLQQLTYLRSQASCRDIGSGSVPEGCLSSQRPRGRFLAFGGHFLGPWRPKKSISSASFWQGFHFPVVRAPPLIS